MKSVTQALRTECHLGARSFSGAGVRVEKGAGRAGTEDAGARRGVWHARPWAAEYEALKLAIAGSRAVRRRCVA